MHGRVTRLGRTLLALLGTLSMVLALASSALAAGPSTAQAPAEGEPTIDQTRPVGYYIWHNEGGFHLRTHGPGDQHLFEARLRTDGVNFRVRDGERLRFNLHLDGQPIGTESIYLGRDGRHPPSNPFAIRI